MTLEIRCKICGESWVENGSQRCKARFIEHVRKFHPEVVFLEDIMVTDRNYWKRDLEGLGHVASA
jgi:hypothetical protein